MEALLMLVVAKSFDHCRAALRRREIPCPDCGLPLRPRGLAGPLKKLRGLPGGQDLEPGPRLRGQCYACGHSHVLQPASVAARRADTVPVLACALLAAADGLNAARTAALLERPAATVRGWLAQARAFAAANLPALTSVLDELGTSDGMRPIQATVLGELAQVLPALARAAAARWGEGGLGEWEGANLICRGRLISASFRMPVYRELITATAA
jgi:hypothetical protein